MVLKDRVVPYPFHIGTPFRSCLTNFEFLSNIRIDTLVHKIDYFPERSTMNIKLSYFVGSHKIFVTYVSAHSLKNGKLLVFVKFDLFWIFTPRKDDAKHVFYLRHELIHFNSHLSSYLWIGWNKLNTLVFASFVSILLNDATITEGCAISQFKDWCLSFVKSHMPWLFIIEADRCNLEIYPLRSKGISASCRERT